MKIDLFTEDDIEVVESYDGEVDSIPALIKELEEEDSYLIVDFVRIDEAWYEVCEDLSLERCEPDYEKELRESYDDSVADLVSESGWFGDLLNDELEDLDENLRRRVSSDGKIRRVRSRQVRQRQATRTTGMTTAARRRRGRKAARSRKRNPAGQRRANRKRGRAMRRRRQMGVSRGS